MMAKKTTAQHLARVLEAVTRQSGRLPETPAYGSWLLGTVTENPHRRRVRIQVMLMVFPAAANLIGIAVAVLLVTVVFPVPSLFTDAARWVTFAVAPAYVVIAFAFDTYWNSRWMVANLQWATEQRRPSPADARNTFLAPLRVAVFHLVWWVVGAALLTTLLAPSDMMFIPKILFSVSFCGVLVATCSYLFTEFALRPAAAKALEAGPPPRRFALGIMGRTMTVWMLSTGVPVILIMLTAIFALTLRNLTLTQFGVAVLILSVATLVAGVFLMWILSGLTATSIRVVRSALRQVEQGELTTNLVVFDGTELGELQSGFNAMVIGLRERERLRDLFGRHVGREVAAAAEREQPRLGGEERDVAVVFIDIVGSTQVVTSRPATEVVQLLNRFFAVIVHEVDRHHGLVNKFAGDASLAVFGAPNRLACPEDAALAAARAIADRLPTAVPECPAGVGVASGRAVAGNVGARERFEYTVIGDPVHEAARLCELAKSTPQRLLASWTAVQAAGENERAHWELRDTVVLRGRDQPTLIAGPQPG